MIFLIFWHIFSSGWGVSLTDVSMTARWGLLTGSLIETGIELLIVVVYVIAWLETKAEIKTQKRLQEIKNAHI